MIELTDQPIDPNEVIQQVASPNAGAIALFLGVVREMTDGRRTVSLDYECYAELAKQELARLVDEAQNRWPLQACRVVHRLGHLEVTDISVAIAVSSPHRHAAFEAAQWLIDQIKQTVPIWKKENWSDGTSEWVHPVGDSPANPHSESCSE